MVLCSELGVNEKSPPWYARCGLVAIAPARPRRVIREGDAALPVLRPQPIAAEGLAHYS